MRREYVDNVIISDKKQKILFDINLIKRMTKRKYHVPVLTGLADYFFIKIISKKTYNHIKH